MLIWARMCTARVHSDRGPPPPPEKLHLLFNHAEKRNKFFGKNPVRESGIPQFNDKKERVLTIDEQHRLLNACTNHLRDILQIALNTGMRRGEILGLRWEWIDFDENIINLPQTHTKTNRARKVPVNEPSNLDGVL